MRHVEAILFGGLAAAVGLSLLFGLFGAVARLSAFNRGLTPENSRRHALVRGGKGGLRFGLVMGLLCGGLGGYIAGPEVFEFALLAKWFLAVGVLIVLATLFGLCAGSREEAWKKGEYEQACPLPPF